MDIGSIAGVKGHRPRPTHPHNAYGIRTATAVREAGYVVPGPINSVCNRVHRETIARPLPIVKGILEPGA